MKLTNATLAILAATLVLVVGMVVLVIVVGKDATQLVAFASFLIPSLIGLVGVQKASRAEANSAQAVHNTNGRMSELVGAIMSAGGVVPAGYEDVEPSIPASLVPVEHMGDEQGPRT